MATIRNAIDEWFNSKIRGATVITQNTEAYNHLVQAVEELKENGWAQLEIGRDMPPLKNTGGDSQPAKDSTTTT